MLYQLKNYFDKSVTIFILICEEKFMIWKKCNVFEFQFTSDLKLRFEKKEEKKDWCQTFEVEEWKMIDLIHS